MASQKEIIQKGLQPPAPQKTAQQQAAEKKIADEQAKAAEPTMGEKATAALKSADKFIDENLSLKSIAARFKKKQDTTTSNE